MSNPFETGSYEKLIQTIYASAVRAASNVFRANGYKSRYAAYLAASNTVANWKSQIEGEFEPSIFEPSMGLALAPYVDQKTQVHEPFVSEAVLCAEMRDAEATDRAPSDVVFLPPVMFQRALPMIRGAVARKAYFWAVALKALTGKCLFSKIQLAKALRCPLKDASAAVEKLIKARLFTRWEDLSSGKTDYEVVMPDPDWDYYLHFGETCPSGDTFFPIRLSDLVYDFDGAYWITFASAFAEPADFLAVLTKKERAEVQKFTEQLVARQISPDLTEWHRIQKEPVSEFGEEYRETSHLLTHGEVVADNDSWLEDGENGEVHVVLCPAAEAFFRAVSPQRHLMALPFHGRNTRLRAVKRLRDQAELPCW